MKRSGKSVLFIAAFAAAVVPLLSQTPSTQKPAFDVVSIKPSDPNLTIRGGGPLGNRFSMTGASLRMLLQNAYTKASTGGPLAQLQIINGPSWIDSDRWNIEATVDCSGAIPTREQVQLMVQSMLEDRFQLKAHLETRELPVYHLVAAKGGPKLKASEDQTPPNSGPGGPIQPCGPVPEGLLTLPPPPPPPGQRGGPGDPNFVVPRGAMFMMMSPTGMTVQASGQPIGGLINMLQNQIGRTIVDKTDLKGLYDFKLTFSPEGLNSPARLVQTPPPGIGPGAPGAPAGIPPTDAAEPVPSLFSAIQELGLRLESTKGPVEVLVVDSVQKPTEN